MKSKHIFFLSAICGMMMLTTSCSGDLDAIHPRNAILQSELTDTDLNKLVNGMYATMESYTYSFWWIDDLQGENFKGAPSGGQIVDPLDMAPSFTNQTVNILSFWRSSFSTINQINFLVESYENAADKETPSMKAMGSAAYFFRALVYYRLTSHYGNVPIMRKRSRDIVPISKESEVWAFVEEDMKKALAIAPSFSSKWYISADAVNALAARVALFQGKKSEAVAYADAVIKNSTFQLTSTSMDFSKNFIQASPSPEIIFAFVNNSRPARPLVFANYTNDLDGSWSYSPSDWCFANLYANDNVYARKNDVRKSATFSSDPTRIIKFSNGVNQLAPNPDYTQIPIILFRLPEMYLIKAEALGKDAGASVLIDFLKHRYKTVPVEGALKNMSDADYQLLILDERRREFFAEGMRWQDIKRTYRLDLLETLKGRSYLMYYPIPQAEIDIAGTEAYPQNPGYAGAANN